MRVLSIATVVVACGAAPAFAQTPDANGNMPAPIAQPSETAPPVIVKPGQAAPPPRFTFNRVETGFLRLDTQTGQVALCSGHAVGWTCEMVPEDRAALEKEIARLQDEVASLKQQLAALQPPSPPRPPALVPDTSDKKLPLPTTEDVARARAYIEDAWRRLVEMLMNFQKDVMRRT